MIFFMMMFSSDPLGQLLVNNFDANLR